MQRVSSQELSEWYAYNLIDPFTEERADKRSAIIARVAATGLLKGAFGTNEFRAMPKEIQQMSLESMGNVLRSMVSQS